MEILEAQNCIHECQRCHAVCLSTIDHCLKMGGRHGHPNHIRLMLDCIQICQTTADFMLRGSALHMHICAACAKICAHCAAECSDLDDDELMRRCVDVCRSCAESCWLMDRDAPGTFHAGAKA